MKLEKNLSKKYYKVKINIQYTNEFKLELLNLFLFELGLSSIEQQIYNNKEEFFIYLPIENYDFFIKKIYDFCERNSIIFKVEEFKEIDDSYLYKWQQYFKPVLINNLLIKPSWIDLKIIEIDPKNSFGTGNHPTTRICIEFIINISKKNQNITFIDCGCGSGILSLVASKYGYKKIVLFDKDFEATKISKENLIKNKCKEFYIFCGSFNALKEIKFDVVCVNILSSIIIKNQKKIRNLVKEGGYLILSGLESAEEKEFLKRFSMKNLNLINKKEKEGWMGYLFKKYFSNSS